MMNIFEHVRGFFFSIPLACNQSPSYLLSFKQACFNSTSSILSSIMFKPISRVRGTIPFTEIPKIRRVFVQMDVDESGALSSMELNRLLIQFGIGLSGREVGELMKLMDADGSGYIEFEEFILWFPTLLALRDEARVLNRRCLAEAKFDFLPMDDDQDGCAEGVGGSTKRRRGAATSRQPFRLSGNWKHIVSMLPYKKNDEIQQNRRDLLFNDFDGNANGFLSLAEVDKGLRDVLKLPELFNVKPVIMRAFQASKNVHTLGRAKQLSTAAARNGGWRKGGFSAGRPLSGEDYVERSEFRLLLRYLLQYFELYLMFEEIDGSDDGGDGVDDRRISLSEFTASFPLLQSWGLPADMHAMDPAELFKLIDADHHGMILFSEFADWALTVSLLGDAEGEGDG